MRKTITLLTMAAIFVGCGESKNENEISRDERLKFIRGIEEKSFGDAANFDKGSALLLVKQYSMFADENPDDELTPNFLFKAGDISMGLENSGQAIACFDRIIEDYKEFEKLPYCYFLRAFIYENQVKDMDKAKEAYEKFIEDYPNHEMTESAKFSLKNLGKTPEELIREFEKTGKSTQAGS